MIGGARGRECSVFNVNVNVKFIIDELNNTVFIHRHYNVYHYVHFSNCISSSRFSVCFIQRKNTVLGNGPFKKWLEKADRLEADLRSDSLQENAELAEAHEVCAVSGETNSEVEEVEHHFISYVNCDGILYEMGWLQL